MHRIFEETTSEHTKLKVQIMQIVSFTAISAVNLIEISSSFLIAIRKIDKVSELFAAIKFQLLTKSCRIGSTLKEFLLRLKTSFDKHFLK